jgi:hypothetical protein
MDTASVSSKNPFDTSIRVFLNSQRTEEERGESKGSMIADLDGDDTLEGVSISSLYGPTYWHYTSTVFEAADEGYQSAASFQLNGEAELSSVENGLILLDQKTFAENDPLCCPSLVKQMRYRWNGQEISVMTKTYAYPRFI